MPPDSAGADRLLSEMRERLTRTWRALPGVQRMGITITVLLLPIVCTVAAVTTYRHYPRTYRIEGYISVPAKTGAFLARFERSVENAAESAFDRLTIRRQEPVPLLVASILVRDRTPDRAIEQVNAELDNLFRELTAATTQPATQPERQIQRDRLRQELEQLDARMAALPTQPAEGPADPRALLAAWQKTLEERQALDAAIAQLDTRLQQPPPGAADVTLTPEQLSAAIAADPRLQADSEVLAQREGDLAEVVRRNMDATPQVFIDLARTTAAADQYFEETLDGISEQDVKEAMQVIRNALSNCSKAGAAMSRTWQAERQALDAAAPDLDVCDRYKRIETAALDFVESTENSLARLQKSLDAIGSSGGDPTKRLILRNAIIQQIQPALDARASLVGAARRLTSADNVEVAALVQSASGLRAQVGERRARLEQVLRDQTLADLRAAYENDAQQTRTHRDELARKAAGLEADIVRGAGQALALLSGSQAREAALAELVELTRHRPELATKLAAIERADAEENAEAHRLGKLSCHPAVAVDLTSPRRLALCTVAGGIAPILMLVVIVGIFWAVRMWQRPRASLDEYAKALSRVPRRALTKRPAQE